MTKEIELSEGKTTLVDDENYEYLNQWKWRVHSVKGVMYARRLDRRDSFGRRRYFYIHRIVSNAPKDKKTKWLDGNTLNNQKNNLGFMGFENEEDRKAYVSERNKSYSIDRKLKVINAYGGICACCGEDEIEFMCIDHVNGGGNKERETGLRGSGFYAHLIRERFPKGYRVLCYNCNASYGLHGYCPHQKAEAI